MGQAHTSTYSQAPRAPSSPSSASSAHYRSGVSSPSHYPSGVSSPSHYAATVTSRTQSMVIPASGGASANARLSAVESIGARASVSASSARRSSTSGLKSGALVFAFECGSRGREWIGRCKGISVLSCWVYAGEGCGCQACGRAASPEDRGYGGDRCRWSGRGCARAAAVSAV